jgi:hypothetical protein
MCKYLANAEINLIFIGPCILIYSVITNDCRGFNNFSYTIHLR